MSAGPGPAGLDPSSLDGALLARLVGFGRYLRRYGLNVGTGRILLFCRAAALLDPFDPGELRAAARATLVSRREDCDPLDAAFDRYFRGGVLPEVPGVSNEAPQAAPLPAGGPNIDGLDANDPRVDVAAGWSGLGIEDDELEGETAIRIVASDAEVLRAKDFADLTEIGRAHV